jgi:hypothetical protein
LLLACSYPPYCWPRYANFRAIWRVLYAVGSKRRDLRGGGEREWERGLTGLLLNAGVIIRGADGVD